MLEQKFLKLYSTKKHPKIGLLLNNFTRNTKLLFSISIFFVLSLIYIDYIYALSAPKNIPRITPQQIKHLIIFQKIKYIFIDSSTFGNAHICGAIYIAYWWCPPYGKERIKNIKIPKNYYLFCYCT